MKRSIRGAVALALASTCLHVHADPLPAGISGAWFDPQHPGHGLSVEILSDEHAVVFWYTYDHDGNPLNLYLEGRIDGTELSGTAYAPRGMRFGSFDPAQLQLNEWGHVRLRFDDCNHGTLEYNADDAAFGSGEIPLLRLTKIKDSTCALGFPSRLPGGAYDATFRFGGMAQETRTAVDHGGTLHMVTFLRGTDGLPAQLQEAPNRPLLVVRGSPLPPNDGNAHIALEVRNNTWFNSGGLSSAARAMTLEVDADGTGETLAPIPGVDAIELAGTTATRALAAGLDLATLAGEYRFVVEGPLPQTHRIDIGADGVMCMRADHASEECATATIELASGGFFDFTFDDGTLSGTGWLETDSAGTTRTLVLVGDIRHVDAGGRTFGIVAESR